MTPLDDVWRLCDHFDAMANRGAGEPRPRPEDGVSGGTGRPRNGTMTRQNTSAGGVATNDPPAGRHLLMKGRQMDHSETAARMRPNRGARG